MLSDPSRQSSYITKLSATEAAAAKTIIAELSPLSPDDRRLALAFVAARGGFGVSFQIRARNQIIRAFNQIWSSDLPYRPHPPHVNAVLKQSGSWAVPDRAIPPYTSPTEVSMPTETERPNWTKLELESVKPLRQVEELTSLDRDTLARVYPNYLVRLSPKRLGMKFRNVLKIMNGDAAKAAS